MRRYFTFKNEISDKFWSIEVVSNDVTVVYGKTGSAGNANTKSFVDIDTAKKEAEKLIKSKTSKGYVEDTNTEIIEFNEALFWGLIARSKAKAEAMEEQPEILAEILSHRSIKDIIAFDKYFEHFHRISYTSELWGAAYIINGGCSDDGFDYFRGWLIAQGKDVFFKALEEPDSLVKIVNRDECEEFELEDMLNVAKNAYELKTGDEDDKFFELTEINDSNSTHDYNIEFNWTEDGDELEKMFPKLYKKFN